MSMSRREALDAVIVAAETYIEHCYAKPCHRCADAKRGIALLRSAPTAEDVIEAGEWLADVFDPDMQDGRRGNRAKAIADFRRLLAAWRTNAG